MLARFRSRIRRILSGPPQAPAYAGEPPPVLQMYPGYEASDIDLVRTFVVGPASVDGDRYTDGFGVQTLHACVPFQQPAALHLGRLALPFPDDGFHAEAIEYTAMADAMRRARGRKSFCAVEIGAGWGPWVVACGVIARRNGVKDIHLVGVEASTERFELMRRHVQTNGFPVPDAGGEDAAQDGFSVRLFRGAIWINDGSIWFPESDVADMGPAVSEEDAGTDYRGTRARHTQVACRRMETLMAGRERVDFMHIDIQGAEFDVINTSIDWIHSHVAALMIATHSRVIEGRLIELLLARGWKLHREKPCQVHWSRECELPGRTWADGSQYWINPALF